MIENEWILIPGGKFVFRARHRVMEGDCQAEHGPVLLHMPDFYLQKYPVTNAMYDLFQAETGYFPVDAANFRRNRQGALDDAPAVWLSPTVDQAYAVYAGGSLPSDSQWQYAIGGPDRSRWPWGDRYDAAFCNAKGNDLTPVHAYPGGVSHWGVWDACGNAWEWVGGDFDDGEHRFALVRGGSYYRAKHFWHIEGGPHPVDSHEKIPLLNEALNRCATVGFRCVKGEDAS